MDKQLALYGEASDLYWEKIKEISLERFSDVSTRLVESGVIDNALIDKGQLLMAITAIETFDELERKAYEDSKLAGELIEYCGWGDSYGRFGWCMASGFNDCEYVREMLRNEYGIERFLKSEKKLDLSRTKISEIRKVWKSSEESLVDSRS
ncbi:MAG: hypothetical protein ABIH72_04685 [archaeon]